MNSVNVIPVGIKDDPSFKNHLAFLARSDAHHDLKKEFTNEMYKNVPFIRNAFNSGIPVPATEIYHETGALAASILVADEEPINSSTGSHGPEYALMKALKNVKDCTNDTIISNEQSKFTIGIGETTMFNYQVVKFMMECKTNTNDMKDVCKINFGKTFVENTKLGGEIGNDAALIVDFSQHHFMENLAEGEQSNFTIHYLMTPEVVNDPAGKPNVHNQNYFKHFNGGVNMTSYVQANIEPTSYTPYDSYDPSPANNFFSNYNFTLSPIKQLFRKGKAEILITTLDIDYDDDKTDSPPLTDTISDSKGENSVTSVLGYLKNIIQKIKSSTGEVKREDAFSFNSKCQQKRGGDWFQVLSCIDVKSRMFNQILPEPEPNYRQPVRIPVCPVYLVTHDQIAVSYALFNGVNVIYLDYFGNIFVFKNSADPTLQGDGRSMKEHVFDGLRQRWKDDLESLLISGNRYTSERNSFLVAKEMDFIKTCKNIEMQVRSLEQKQIDIGEIQNVMTTQLQRLFTEAVTLMFSQHNLIDISLACNFVDTHKNILNKENYSDDMEIKIDKLSNSITNLQSVQKRFGLIAKKENFAGLFESWINSNVTKLDVYKTAKNILSKSLESDKKTFDLSRLITFFNKTNNTERKTDSHIFLPFIESLDISSRNAIKNVLKTAVEVTTKYGELINRDGQDRPRRNGQISPNLLFFNKLGNLIHESLFFCTTEEDVIIIEPPFVSESTDNILLETDLQEYTTFVDIGKSSNFASEDPVSDDTTQTQTGGSFIWYQSKNSENRRKKTPAFCNVSVKQITRPLLTDLLLTPHQIKESASAFDIFRRIIYKDNKMILEDKYLDDIDEYEDKRIRDQENLQFNAKVVTGATLVGAAATYAGYGIIVSPETTALIGMVGVLSYGVFTALNKNNMVPDVSQIRNVLPSLPSLLPKEVVHRQDMSYSPVYVPPQSFSPEVEGGSMKNVAHSSIRDDLMSNHSIGYHPLVPIYCILAAYYSTISSKSEGDPFFYTYFTYFNVLEKMKQVIVTKYLDDLKNFHKSIAAYLLGFGMNVMLFTSNTSLIQSKQILDVVKMKKHDFSTFSLKNDIFAGLFTGAIHQDKNEEVLGMSLVNNALFEHFINKQVNIKKILEDGTPVRNLPGHETLKKRVFKLMNEIVKKVSADRIVTGLQVPYGINGMTLIERKEYAIKQNEKYKTKTKAKTLRVQKSSSLQKSRKSRKSQKSQKSQTSRTSRKSRKSRKSQKSRKSRKSPTVKLFLDKDPTTDFERVKGTNIHKLNLDQYRPIKKNQQEVFIQNRSHGGKKSRRNKRKRNKKNRNKTKKLRR